MYYYEPDPRWAVIDRRDQMWALPYLIYDPDGQLYCIVEDEDKARQLTRKLNSILTYFRD